MSENWTKGPWHVNGDKIESTIGACRARIAIIDDGAGTNPTASAHLIAAAPDLYAALKAIIDDLPISRDWLDPVNERWAKDALKKARGES